MHRQVSPEHWTNLLPKRTSCKRENRVVSWLTPRSIGAPKSSKQQMHTWRWWEVLLAFPYCQGHLAKRPRRERQERRARRSPPVAVGTELGKTEPWELQARQGVSWGWNGREGSDGVGATAP